LVAGIISDRILQEENVDEIEALKLLLQAATQTRPLGLQELPDFVVNRFTGSDGALVNLVVVYPNMMLADGRASIQFREDAGTVNVDGRQYAAASTALIGASILQIMQREAWWLMFAPLLTAGVLMMVFFRSWKWGLLAFAPLAAGLLLLTGGMAMVGLKFNIYNIIVLPAVLGVGADNGVHLFHRVRELLGQAVSGDRTPAGSEATVVPWVLKTTGVYITASSFTTMLGFAGLMFTGHPGLQSMGLVAVTGIGLSLFCAVILAVVIPRRMFS
jgi:predicted RND superfamily exporter protein